MAELAIKDLPSDLEHRLKRSADRHHRSITGEVLALLDQALPGKDAPRQLPLPVRGRFPLSQEFLDKARTEGRS